MKFGSFDIGEDGEPIGVVSVEVSKRLETQDVFSLEQKHLRESSAKFEINMRRC